MTPKPSNRPRRQAKQARSQQTVRDILESAARVLEHWGYARATTNRIAKTAGVSVGTLYEYFADKEEIFDALIQQQIDELVTVVARAPIAPDAAVGPTLRRLLEVAMTALRGGPSFMRQLEQVPGASFRSRLQAGRDEIIAFLRLWLESHRDELRVTDLDLAAFVVVSTAEALAMNASDELFGDALVHEIGTLLSLYLTGIEASSSS